MDFKKLIADLATRYRKLTEPISSSSLAPPGQVVDVDAAHEAGRKAGYEAGYKKGYDEGLQVGLEAKTLPEPSGPKSQSEPPSESPPPPLSLYDRLGGVYSIATVIDDFIDRVMIDPRLNANPKVDEAHHRVPPARFGRDEHVESPLLALELPEHAALRGTRRQPRIVSNDTCRHGC
jgi:hypothetical protein